MKVPTCQLQHGFSETPRARPYPPEFDRAADQRRVVLQRRGVSILATCTPYQVGNLPVRGEHVAWMESSAVVYANSVLGARTNCEGGASTGAASLTGKIPYWGNHHDDNRLGTHLVQADSGSTPSRTGGCSATSSATSCRRPARRSPGPRAARSRRPQALRRRNRDVGRCRDLPHRRHHARGADAGGGLRRSRVPEPVVFGEAEERGAYDTLNGQGSDTMSTSSCSAARTRRSTRSRASPSCSTAGVCTTARSSG